MTASPGRTAAEPQTVSVVLFGADGRMGHAVEAAAASLTGVRIKAKLDRTSGAPAADLQRGDVVIDFSSPEGLLQACALCGKAGAPLVTGTTGLGPEHERALTELGKSVAVLRASNFSLGVLALRRAVQAALATLPRDWDVEIVERHHKHKADAPSGTALTLAREIAENRGVDERAYVHGREGRVGERPPQQIGLHAVRGGSWVGFHEVLLAGAGEWLELRHVAQDRAAFANGALAAARFVATAPAGVDTLEDLATGGRP